MCGRSVLKGWVLALALGAWVVPGLAFAQLHESFRVATYNVRHVTGDDTGVYAWSARQASVLGMIRANNPDVFGVQEASSAVIHNALKAEFEGDYDFYKPAGGSPKMIFFRRARFERLAPNQEGNISLPNPYAESEDCFPNAKGRTSAWVKVKDRKSGRKYMFVNVHTAHEAKCWKARNESAVRLHALLAEHVAPDVTFVVFGDFNMDEQRASGGNSSDKMVSMLEESKTGYRLRMSARHSGTTTKSTSTFNNSWKKPSTTTNRLDYIFVSTRDATTYRQAVDQRTIKDVMGSGAAITPSDHYLVRAEVRHAPFAYTSIVSEREGTTADHRSFGDVNGDGAVDLITWKSTVDGGRVHVHLADGAGKFAKDPIVDTVPGPSGEWRYFADVDGDGCADRIAWSAAIDGGRVRVGKSLCNGAFEAAVAASAGTTKSGTQWFFAHLNDDACMDRVAWHPEVSGGKPRVALAACDGSLKFLAEVVNTDAGVSTNSGASFAFVDVDGDGLADKVLWDKDQFGGRSRVYKSRGDGTFVYHSEQSGGSSGNASTKMFFGDMDGDGRADKAFWRNDYRQGRIQLYPTGASGLGAHPIMVNNGPSTSVNAGYHLADVNGDGSDDLIRWNTAETPSKMYVYLSLLVKSADVEPEPDDGDVDVEIGDDVGYWDGGGDEEDVLGAVDVGDFDDDQDVEDGANENGSAGTVTLGSGGCGCSSTRGQGVDGSAGGLLLFGLYFVARRRRCRG